MKIRTRLVSCALAAALLSSVACLAQPDRPRDDSGGPPPPRVNPILALFDADKDGVLSAEEIANASAVLKALDKNGDGQLTADEFPAPPPRGPGKPGRGAGGPGPAPEGEETALAHR
ncbi:hypothetical protein OpiT1DRAFT_02722 [Opitutaceae bacterium TAV1]|nr:hypothetical protein OpiT1DRAFT_02722 [Opitutaceae bacterium TAV1]